MTHQFNDEHFEHDHKAVKVAPWILYCRECDKEVNTRS